MEEIGKAGFVLSMTLHDQQSTSDWAAKWLDDHEPKRMWPRVPSGE